MMLLKGSLLGVSIFVVGTIAYTLIALQREGSANAIGLNVIRSMTIHNPYFWAALVACLVIGCAMVATWPTRVAS